MDFSDINGKRLLLIVENLNMLLGQQLGDHHEWELRHTLQNESRLMLLGTATENFDGIKNVGKAWFELFYTHELKPLSLDECKELWNAMVPGPVSEIRLRPLMILTGGNPRLLRILADFSSKKSFKELMDNLLALIDSHTEYFKSQLDSLAPMERKPFVALLDIWDPATAKQVSVAARMSVGKVAAMLKRLMKKGLITTVNTSNRRKLYQVSERLFNIYYLMRRRSRPADRVRAAVNFMVNFYDEEDLVKSTAGIAEEACSMPPEQTSDHYLAYQEIVRAADAPELKSKIIKATPQEFFAFFKISENEMLAGQKRRSKTKDILSRRSVAPTEAELNKPIQGEEKPASSNNTQRLIRQYQEAL
ncbi:MAG: hypothetical protein KIT22_20505, partial [Verrucomicrobiae bacterium]|nr:hypothetical protein [Verrucomicrobiae bacterium]